MAPSISTLALPGPSTGHGAEAFLRYTRLFSTFSTCTHMPGVSMMKVSPKQAGEKAQKNTKKKEEASHGDHPMQQSFFRKRAQSKLSEALPEALKGGFFIEDQMRPLLPIGWQVVSRTGFMIWSR